jgi:hypothetical protein
LKVEKEKVISYGRKDMGCLYKRQRRIYTSRSYQDSFVGNIIKLKERNTTI